MQPVAYDYIVIGSGSAGGAIAARLTESGKYRVLCLEAGTKGADYIFSKPPAANVFMVDNPAVDWCYQSVPNESHGNRSIPVPRGKMLGGSSAINGSVYNRGQRVDYDTWAQMGCRGWSYDDVLPIFKKMESTDLGSDEFRGRNGPVKVTEASKITPFYEMFMQAAVKAGYPRNADYSGASQEGVCMAQQTVYRGQRVSTATAYLKPAMKRPNLTVLSGAETTSLILEGKTCVGVRFRRNGAMEEARASREVIVSCGTSNSPKLLELAGIGNPEILEKFGIPVVQELPGVGENLHDHYGAVMKWRINKGGISLAKSGNGLGLAREALRYVLFRTGFIAQGLGSMRLFGRSRPDLENPDFMMVVAPFMIDWKPPARRKISPVEGFFMFSHVQRTESAGSIHIASADPFAPPAINFRFLDTPGDRMTAVLALRRAREVVAMEPIGPIVAEELQPGPSVQTDEEILDFLRKFGAITQHMTGTCKMGHDPMSVVDDRLRVHGILGLRVADASIMPTMPSGNTSAPAIMIGEKCAEMVLQDAGR